ncbi:cell wall-binding repeat-containing protein [Peptacetobacter hiranonis]|uniref:cell wall-binding repeat-containing protein n=1 Tax=Peptacetobacter hiranonis TaxID=89152 RepID=UPI0022E7A284|nr:cell wall-binding repeat-containing protein [Peptacetobacter hiranonis]
MRKRITTLTLSAIMLLSTIAPISAVEKLDRIQGKSNYEIAAKIADKRAYSSAVLVNMNRSTADGLSAAALAGCKDGVILLVGKDGIPAETMERLEKVTNIYIIGQENAVPKSIEEKLIESGKYVTRIGGSDRFETSYEVAKEVLKAEGSIDKVFIANGLKGEADVVSSSPVAYRDKAPILLTDGNELNNNLKEIANDASSRYIVGGTTVVKESVKNGLKGTERINGDNRYITNQKVVEKFYSNPKEFNIVGDTDYAIATIASSISTEKPIALVNETKDPLILKNAQKMTAVGNISENDIAKAIGYSGGFNHFNYGWTKHSYIAHALGGIDGKRYTNSLQALEYNYKKGFRVFEVDLDIASDGELIACHAFDKNALKELGLPEKYSKQKPTSQEFKKQKLCGKYNTMTFKDIVSYMEKHPDMYTVIDLKQATNRRVREVYKKIVEDASPEVLERIIPQIYREELYNEIMKIYDFKSAAFTCYTMQKLNADQITNFCAMNGIKVLVIEGRFYANSLMEKCRAKGIKLYMNTYNDQNEVNSFKKKGAQGFFTDFLTP